MSRGGKLYLAAVMVAGAIAGLGGLRFALAEPAPDLAQFQLLFGLALFATLLFLLQFRRPTRQATSGVSTLVFFGALLLTQPETVALVLAVRVADFSCQRRDARPPWFVFGFNTAQLLLAALAAHLVNQAFRPVIGSNATVQSVAVALPAALAFAVVNYGLVWGAHHWVGPIEGGMQRILKSEGLEEMSLFMIAFLARAAWTVQPLLVVLACGPLILFWRLYSTVTQLEYRNAALLETEQEAVDGLVQALAARDNEVSGHSQRVAQSTSVIAAAIGIDPLSSEYIKVVRGALLHDVGKIGVRDAVLHKPGKLTPEEWNEMRDHAARGYALVNAYPFLAEPAEIVLAHHERWDGKGYPRGMRGEEIPLGARIFAVADTFDAITSPRPYKPAHSIDDAVAEIVRCSGTQFDPNVVAIFLQLYTELPTVPRSDVARMPRLEQAEYGVLPLATA